MSDDDSRRAAIIMSIGTGIFLSSIFLGLVALIIFTRDKWKWGRILTRTAIGLAVLAALSCAGFYGYHLYTERPTKELDLWGVKLGDTKADVRFKKGTPVDEKDDRWIYDGADYPDKFWATVSFRNGRVSIVELGPKSGSAIPMVQGVGEWWTAERLIRKFGQPSLESSSSDDTSRLLSFRKHNLAFELQKNAVKGVMVFDGTLTAGMEYRAPAEDANASGTPAK